MHFQRKRKIPTVTQDELLGSMAEAAPVAFVDLGRPEYLTIHDADMEVFLEQTKVDRFVWREATPADDSVEMVCTSFSVLLMGLVEQERLKCRLKYPLAFGRVRLLTHSMCIYLNQYGEIRLIEPQNDHIWYLADYAQSQLDRGMERPEIQTIFFQ